MQSKLFSIIFLSTLFFFSVLSVKNIIVSSDNVFIRPQISSILTSRQEFQKWIGKFNECLEDGVAFRNKFVALFQSVHLKAGISGSNQCLVGRNGWLFYTMSRSFENFRGLTPMNERNLEAWVATLESRKKWLEKRGIPLLVVMAPDKQTVYPDELPTWMVRSGRKTRADQLFRRFDQGVSFQYLDLRPILQEGRKRTAAPLYYKYDSHWNYEGANLAYRAVIARLQKMGLQAVPLTTEDFEWKKIKMSKTDMTRILGLDSYLQESYLKPIRVNGSRVFKEWSEDDPYLPQFKIEHFKADGTTNLKLMVVRDSFTAVGFNTFITETFKETVFFHHAFKHRFDTHIIDKEKPDVVIIMFVERFLDIWPEHNPAMFEKDA